MEGDDRRAPPPPAGTPAPAAAAPAAAPAQRAATAPASTHAGRGAEPPPLSLGAPARPVWPKRCSACNKKLPPAVQLIATCGPVGCGAAFCTSHRPFEAHACPSDYRAAQKRTLAAALIPSGDLAGDRAAAKRGKFGLDI
jgi:hypothetical protein